MSDTQFAQLQQRLREDATVRERLRAELNLDSALRDLAAGDLRLEELWNAADTPAMRWRGRRRWATVALLTAACLILAIVWSFFVSDDAPISGTLAHHGGDVVIVDTTGRPRKLESDARILAGDNIRTRGDESFAAIEFEDGTRVLIIGDSSISVDSIKPKRIAVLSGRVSARVAEQPAGRPMVVVTTRHSVEVLGTEFAIEASRDHTDLQVSEGQVRMTRNDDGQSVLVPQGRRVVSDVFAPDLIVRDSERAGDTWEEDFEDGLPHDWQIGELVQDGIPERSSGAVRNVYDSRWDSYLIDSPKRWIEGLFVVQADTHIHFVFKTEWPGWLNIFLQGRTNDDSDPTDMFKCAAAPFGRAQPGKWYSMSIPIAEWKRNDDVGGRGFVDPPPKPGEVVYMMSWSSRQQDRGLVIDRVWVTRGGTGRIEMKALASE